MIETLRGLTRVFAQPYSRSMTEVGIVPEDAVPPKLREQYKTIRARSAAEDVPETPQRVRAAAGEDDIVYMRDTLADAQGKWDKYWEQEDRQAQEAGTPINADRRQAQQLLAQEGISPVFPREKTEREREARTNPFEGPLMDQITEQQLIEIKEHLKQMVVSGVAFDSNFLEEMQNRITKIKTDNLGTPDVQKQADHLREALTEATHGERLDFQKIVENEDYRREQVNRIFNSVDAFATEPWQSAFNPLTLKAQYENIITTMNDAIKSGAGDRAKLEADIKFFATELNMRERIHDLRTAIFSPNIEYKQIIGYIQATESFIGDFAMKEKGVWQMRDILADVMRESMARNNGWLNPIAMRGRLSVEVPEGQDLPNDVIRRIGASEIEKETIRRFKERLQAGLIYQVTDDGRDVPVPIEGPKSIPEWQIERIFTFATGTMVLDQTLLSLAAESQPGRGTSRIASLFLQKALQGYSELRHLIIKYSVTGRGLTPLVLEDKFGAKGLLNPKEWKKLWEDYEDNPLKYLESVDKFLPLLRTNPFRCGDMYTWQGGWRYDAKHQSIAYEFLERGAGRMWDRNHANDPKASVYEAFIDGLPKRLRPGGESPEKADKVFDPWDDPNNPELAEAERRWQEAHPGAPTLEQYRRFKHMWKDEYEKWTGTALRLENKRTRLTRIKPGVQGIEQMQEFERLSKLDAEAKDKKGEYKYSKKERERIKDAREIVEARVGAEILLQRIVELQPHRLYRVINKRAREDIIALLPRHMQHEEAISAALDNLSIAETLLLQRREQLLQDGYTFDGFLYDEGSKFEAGSKTPTPTNRISYEAAGIIVGAAGSELAKAVATYFDTHRQEVFEEFAGPKREYLHGFALWTGDVPGREFPFGDVGPSGAFSRRASDNAQAEKAAQIFLGIFNTIPNIHTVDELLSFTRKIHDETRGYSSELANVINAELLSMFGKFFRSSVVNDIPFIGLINQLQGSDSLAKLTFGKTAGSFSAEAIRSMFWIEHNAQRLTDEQYNDLLSELDAGNTAVLRSVGSTATELITLAIIFYMISKLNDKV